VGSSVTALAFTWRGRLTKWKPPEEVLPAAGQRIAVLLSIVFLAIAYFYARPSQLEKLYWASGIMGIVVFISFLVYSVLIFTHRYLHPKTGKDILGGLWLASYARTVMRDGILTSDNKRIPPPRTIEELLRGIDDLSLVWSRFSRALLSAAVIALFIIILCVGNLAVGCAGLALQVQLNSDATFISGEMIYIDAGEYVVADFLQAISKGPLQVSMETDVADELRRKHTSIKTPQLKSVSLKDVLERTFLPQLPEPASWTYDVIGKTIIIKKVRQ